MSENPASCTSVRRDREWEGMHESPDDVTLTFRVCPVGMDIVHTHTHTHHTQTHPNIHDIALLSHQSFISPYIFVSFEMIEVVVVDAPRPLHL